jgi:hypothetical protein
MVVTYQHRQFEDENEEKVKFADFKDLYDKLNPDVKINFCKDAFLRINNYFENYDNVNPYEQYNIKNFLQNYKNKNINTFPNESWFQLYDYDDNYHYNPIIELTLYYCRCMIMNYFLNFNKFETSWYNMVIKYT